MKKTLLYLSFSLSLLLSISPVFSQISVISQDGYSVHIIARPKQIITYSNDCTWGYTYNVRIDYHVNFSGPNQPASLYTLQGSLGCGGSSHFFDLPNSPATGSVNSQSNVWNSNSDCATSTVTSLGCMIVTVDIEGPGISARTVTFVASESPLPIKLIDFTAESVAGKVKLNWATATEINNELFSIERSTDGINWNVIKSVKGAGNSSEFINYGTHDESPYTGIAYYRLKQTDHDGKFTYSDTRVVKFSGVIPVGIYPVPNSGNTLNFKGLPEPQHIIMSIRDLAGRTVYTTNLKTNSTQLPSLKAGLYVISLKNTVTGEVNNLRYSKI